MVIGILQFELFIHDAESLKDKRRVVSSLKDRLHREHQVSVAEVGLQESHSVARLGLALVGSDGRHVGQTLDRITSRLRGLTDAELGDCVREVISNEDAANRTILPDPAPDAPLNQDPISHELLRRMEEHDLT
ncbi:MAG: DUF503 domain-containing protein [Phycisphaeraceae bacterium]|nr:DUF503 domain-containing protein [Phycisphaeraceae bacterium]MBX3408610.1 DUF503 domain-containing protein [Phycisphaeraceae bacterium]